MKIGYVRVSKEEQHEDLQIEALKRAGCEKWFTDKMSGAKSDRPGLNQALNYMREGDTLFVWKLDRLGRSLVDLIHTVQEMEKRGIGFTSLTETIDTTTAGGKLIFHVFGALAEFERALIIERTNAGLAAARARGKFGGNTYRLSSLKREMVVRLHQETDKPVKEICQEFGISQATFFRYVVEARERREEEQQPIPSPDILGPRLEHAREQACLSLRQVCKQMSIQYQGLFPTLPKLLPRLEEGQIPEGERVSPKLLSALAKLYGIQMSDLVQIEEAS